MKDYLIYVKTPIIVIILYFMIYFLIEFNYIPPLEKLEDSLIIYYEKYGLFMVAFLSLIENIPGINVYFPGSIVILTAMAYSHGNPTLGLYTYLVIFSFAFIGYHISYYIGRVSSSNLKENKTSLRDKNLFIYFFLTLWHPHSASITCLVAGEDNVPYKKFLKNLIIVGFIWNTFWALLMYNIDIDILKTNGEIITLLIVIYLFLWLGYKTINYLKYNKKTKV